MPYVIAAPEMIAAAATDLATIGSTLSAAHTAAAPTLAVMPAAADEVSASVAHLFSQHAHDYQALAGQATAFHEQFVQHLTASAGSYARAEAANASMLQPLNASTGSHASANTGLGNLLTTLSTNLLSTLSTEWRQVVWPLVRPLVQRLFIDLLYGYVDLLVGYAGFLQNLALCPAPSRTRLSLVSSS